MKAQGHKLECRRGKSALTAHSLASREHQSAYNSAVKPAKATYFSELIAINPGNPKLLFRTINHILNPAATLAVAATSEKCGQFNAFFNSKITAIREQTQSFIGKQSTLPSEFRYPGPSFCNFTSVSAADILPIVSKMRSTSFLLDPIDPFQVMLHLAFSLNCPFNY